MGSGGVIGLFLWSYGISLDMSWSLACHQVAFGELSLWGRLNGQADIFWLYWTSSSGQIVWNITEHHKTTQLSQGWDKSSPKAKNKKTKWCIKCSLQPSLFFIGAFDGYLSNSIGIGFRHHFVKPLVNAVHYTNPKTTPLHRILMKFALIWVILSQET